MPYIKFKIMPFSYIYITINNFFKFFFLKNLVIFTFVIIVLVHFYIILIRNNKFYKKTQLIKFGHHFVLCNRYCVYILTKK